MVFEFLKVFVILLIAVPFGYIVFDVVFDILKRTYQFTRQAKPVLVRVRRNIM